jgi:hypothetical protein
MQTMTSLDVEAIISIKLLYKFNSATTPEHVLSLHLLQISKQTGSVLEDREVQKQ